MLITRPASGSEGENWGQLRGVKACPRLQRLVALP